MTDLSFFSSCFNRKDDFKIKLHYQDPMTPKRLGEGFARLLLEIDPSLDRPLVIVAIGTDRSTGDCLGPLVGTRLKKQHSRWEVYGTLDEPVHASNLEATLQEIKEAHPSALIVAIDACLGKVESVGSITLATGALKPGAGVSKDLPEVGDLHLAGIINVGGYMEFFVLQNTRLNLVMRMADVISQGLIYGYRRAGQLVEKESFPGELSPPVTPLPSGQPV